MATILVSLLAGALVAALAMAITSRVAWRLNRAAVVDVTWGLAFVAVALACAAAGTVLSEGDVVRRWLLVGLVTAWAGRLAWHIGRRAVTAHAGAEDPRYEKLLGGPLREVGLGVAWRKVFAVQGLAVWLVSLPIMLGVVDDVRWWWAVWLGVVVWLVGVVFEAVGDAQLAAYKEIPRDQRPPVMQTGLWRYTRHPNYFGDACVAWGLWLVGGLASGPIPAAVTLIAPAAMTYFLVFATGARLLERTMMQRPGYPEYAARTSMFVPLPPRS